MEEKKIAWGKTDEVRTVWKEGLGVCLEGGRWKKYSELSLNISLVVTVLVLIFRVWV